MTGRSLRGNEWLVLTAPEKFLEELEVNVYGHWSGLLSEDGQDSLGRS